jgi:hypothetical protein
MAVEKQTRGRPSKIDLLPDGVRDQLHQMLREKRHTQEEIREAINELIDGHNLPEDMKLSRTGLNRYASRMEEFGPKFAPPAKWPKSGPPSWVLRRRLTSANC